jgi:hypothetical protein
MPFMYMNRCRTNTTIPKFKETRFTLMFALPYSVVTVG